MATVRLSVRKIREILRLSWGLGLRPGEVAASCNIARSTVQDYLSKAQAAGLSWPLAPEMDDAALENLLFARVGRPKTERPPPDFSKQSQKRKSALLGPSARSLHIPLSGQASSNWLPTCR